MGVYAVTCVRLVCDVFLAVELVGAYRSVGAAVLALAAHAVHAGVGWPRAIDDADDGAADGSGAVYRTPVGDRGDRHVYHLVAVPLAGPDRSPTPSVARTGGPPPNGFCG